MNPPTNPNSLLAWPVIISIEDCFIPELAPLVLEIAETVNMECLGAQCVVEARWAYRQLTKN